MKTIRCEVRRDCLIFEDVERDFQETPLVFLAHWLLILDRGEGEKFYAMNSPGMYKITGNRLVVKFPPSHKPLRLISLIYPEQRKMIKLSGP